MAEFPSLQPLLKPILKGRDINRYTYQPNAKIILASNDIDVENDYPDLITYFQRFGPKFVDRGARGKHWTNLRPTSFLDDFRLPKIVWIELSDIGRFALVTEEVYCLNSAYFMVPPDDVDLYALLGLLNSRLVTFYISVIANTSGVGTLRWINIYIRTIPLAFKQYEPIATLVQQILSAKTQDSEADTNAIEAEIDKLVYQLYDLTNEEIAVIEGQ